MKYRPEIDGLRAIAIVPVVFFHAGFTSFSGGYIGVDIFFVISGFLISSVILEETKSGTFKLVNFYDRRARRILPALFFIMAACIPMSWMLFMPSEMKDFSKSLISVVSFISNIYFWKTSGYFEPAAELKPLLHTWSLAVEEQFYLIFPLLLIAALPLNILKLCLFALIFLFSLISAEINVAIDPVKTFFTFHNRAWELLMGSGVAYILFINIIYFKFLILY
jgi:peptidoglycan/LPS O-acetylase OafA/YrhL